MTTEFLTITETAIAYRRQAGRSPGVAWLGGYRSDMIGTKAETLSNWAGRNDRAFLRHDYSGHGESSGEFRDGTISAWLAQSLAVFRAFGPERTILVGSSMGAWIALRMAQELRAAGEGGRIAGMVLIAPAPDFTAELLLPRLSKRQRAEIEKNGYLEVASDYADDPYIYTRALFEDGERNRILSGPIDTHCPVHILQGLEDRDVPYAHALKLASCLPVDDVTVTLIPGGDHRLSRTEDLDLLVRTVESMIERTH